MPYQCSNPECKKTFSHPAKQIFTYPDCVKIPENNTSTALKVTYTNWSQSIESYVCPFCFEKDFSEFVEPQADIISVKSVPLEEADNWIAQGYKVRELYAKACTLVKTSPICKICEDTHGPCTKTTEAPPT